MERKKKKKKKILTEVKIRRVYPSQDSELSVTLRLHIRERRHLHTLKTVGQGPRGSCYEQTRSARLKKIPPPLDRLE